MLKKISFFGNKNNLIKGILIGDIVNPHNLFALVVCHGFSGSKEGGGKAILMGEYFSVNNITTLIFDFSGNGESEGSFEDITLTGQTKDLLGAINFLKDLGFKKIFIMGRSFGGTTAICYQGFYKDPNVHGLITVNAVAKPNELFSKFIHKQDKNRVILMSDGGTVVVKRKFFDDLTMWNVLSMVGNISPIPILIIQGNKDEVVNPQEGKLLYNSAYNPKELKIIKNGDHTLSNNYKEMWEIVLKFITRYQNF